MTCAALLRAALVFGTVAALPLSAHEGVEHHSPALEAPLPPAVLAERPHRLADGSLFVPKSVQHLLALRTAVVAEARPVETRELVAEVAMQPEAAALLAAPQAGRLEATAAGWPLAGQAVTAGETLAWLRPLLSRRDTAQRSARLADIDQKIAIAQLNVDRIGLQNQANQGQIVPGNIYFEQADAELKALQQQRKLISGGLSERLPLKAAVSGQLVTVTQAPGAAVVAGQTLFELADPTQLRVLATSFDPPLESRIESAAVVLDKGGQPLALRYRGAEPLADRPGWQLLFDPAEGAGLDDLHPGQPVRIALRVQAGDEPAIDPAACVRDAQGHGQVWVHLAPERFAARPIDHCEAASVSTGERIVVAGAALLNQYR
jgi:biotin carboxyl carrier protein